MIANVSLVKMAVGFWKWALAVLDWVLDHKGTVVVSILGSVLFLIIGTALVVEASNQPNYNDPVEVQGSLEGLMRGTWVDQACYDSRIKQYFIHIAAHKPIEKVMDEGWYLYKNPVFMRQQNGSFVETKLGTPTRTVPDITGLQCRTQKVN